jgi:hypothetical protein
VLQTKLQLCQRLRQECVGVSGTGPTTTLAQSGDMLRLVTWIDSAYEDIQNLHRDWNFLRKDLSFNTVAAQQSYTPTQAGAADVGEWRMRDMRCYLTSGGVSGEQFLQDVPWDDFRSVYLLGANRASTGRPMIVTRKPDRSLMVWPTPDAAYTINGEYFQANDEMIADADVPIFPARFHLVVMWRALVFYAGHAAAPETFSVGQGEYTKLLSALERSERPSISW